MGATCPAARAATITFDLLTIAALIVLGMRLRAGREGRRLGLLLAWLWAACPFSLLGMEKSTNDGLVALIVVLVMLALNSPIKRGVLVGVGAASKFFPAILLPLVAVGHGGADQTTVRKVLAGFVIAVGTSIALFLPSGGLKEMWDHTIGFQLTRADIFSIWALHPTLAPLKVAVEAFAVILSVAVAFRPRGARSPGAGGGAGRSGDHRRPAACPALVLPVHRVVPARSCWSRCWRRAAPAATETVPAADAPGIEHGDTEPVLAGTA